MHQGKKPVLSVCRKRISLANEGTRVSTLGRSLLSSREGNTDLRLYCLDLDRLSMRCKRHNILGWDGALPSNPVFEIVEASGSNS